MADETTASTVTTNDHEAFSREMRADFLRRWCQDPESGRWRATDTWPAESTEERDRLTHGARRIRDLLRVPVEVGPAPEGGVTLWCAVHPLSGLDGEQRLASPATVSTAITEGEGL